MIARRARGRLGSRRRGLPAAPVHAHGRLWRDFADAFVDADAVVLTDVYARRGGASAGRVGPARSLRAVLDAHPDAAGHVPAAPRRRGRARARGSPGPATCVLTLGAGDLTTVPDEWLGHARRSLREPRHDDRRCTRSARLPGARRRATRPSRTSRRTELGGPVAVLVRVAVERRARDGGAPWSRRDAPPRARRRPRLEPARRRRRVRRRRASCSVGDVRDGRRSTPTPRPGARRGRGAAARARPPRRGRRASAASSSSSGSPARSAARCA